MAGQYTEITVTYMLEAEDAARLEALLEALKEKGGSFKDAADLFRALMTMGSKWDINEKLVFAEQQAGLIDEDEAQRRRDAWKHKQDSTKKGG